ncbi:hypothetical protein M0R19_05425 [Candidatus Pacearchaeota archaeon]|jgi:hypothetical protein|nr:hypothetical protein [Candidatus Pacearchaeota archaeon]
MGHSKTLRKNVHLSDGCINVQLWRTLGFAGYNIEVIIPWVWKKDIKGFLKRAGYTN